MAAAQAARRAGTFLMEAFMYRPHPQTRRLVELVRDGAVGEARLIEASFGYRASLETDKDAERRIFANALGGGGILDVGCYAVSMARLIAGAALGRPFADPIEVSGTGTLGATGVDEQATATLTFEDGIVAQLQTAVRVPLRNSVTVIGTEGRLEVPQPWFGMGSRGPADGRIDLVRRGGEREVIEVRNEGWLYAIEADEVAAHIEAGEAPSMSHEDTLGNMATLDRWREAIGLVYDAERPEAASASTLAGRPLRRQVVPSDASPLPLADVAGVPMPLSRLVMGCDNQVTMPHAEAMWDDFFERGGNVFDTAHLYTGGVTERLLGTWLGARGVREEVAVIVKGAHTPNCNPDALSRQLEESLERLQIETADLYFLHRDDPGIPIGEWVEVLNDHVRRGQIRVFGGSNWTIERIEAANAYAAEHGLQGFSALSNNFSLARMERPVWPGVLACSDDRFREWLVRRQLPEFSWSSQARRFFTDRGAPERASDDPELANAWFSEANHERRRRAIDLAEERGVEAVKHRAGLRTAPTLPHLLPRRPAHPRRVGQHGRGDRGRPQPARGRVARPPPRRPLNDARDALSPHRSARSDSLLLRGLHRRRRAGGGHPLHLGRRDLRHQPRSRSGSRCDRRVLDAHPRAVARRTLDRRRRDRRERRRRHRVVDARHARGRGVRRPRQRALPVRGRPHRRDPAVLDVRSDPRRGANWWATPTRPSRRRTAQARRDALRSRTPG